MNYSDFLKQKATFAVTSGFESSELNPMLFPFQRDIVKWALKKGRAAIFADCGLGKTPMQLEWAHRVAEHTSGKVLILAPLAVSAQTCREGDKFGIKIGYARSQEQITERITITNYEMLCHFQPDEFVGIVLDESSILKSFTGKVRTEIIETFKETPYKLACTATPAPNDYMELGNHAEFCGAMTRTEMLSMFFVHDGGETSQWRLKGHAENDYWKWISSWAVMFGKPSDLGYSDDNFILPELRIKQVKVEKGEVPEGFLFPVEALTLSERQVERRETIEIRAKKAAEIANNTDGPVLVWCNLNTESETAAKAITGAVEVTGSDSRESKENSMLGFSAGEVRCLVTKPLIAGFGMNWQHCNTVIFLGLSDSYEQFYQAVRRCYRFGQKNPVDVYIVTADTEGAVVRNIERKEADSKKMMLKMVEHISVHASEELHKKKGALKVEFKTGIEETEKWKMILGDCVEAVKTLPENGIDYTIFSPPFASLYTYSASDRDMGNCKDHQEFYDHFKFLIPELFRVTKPGRLLSFHCMNLPTSKCRDGFIGISDFRGELIRLFVAAGWIFHSEVCIWKDPVVAMQRTKALGLLHKQIVKDSCMSRQGIPDYLVTMRKPGENIEPVSGELTYFSGDQTTFQSTGRLSIDIWQRYASPVWMDIKPGNTLQKESAREEKDERHICPLQLDVIERAMQLWTNPEDLVLSPFAGIGSEGFQALKMGRRFVGVELKESYWKQAVANLRKVVCEKENELNLFDGNCQQK